MSQCAYCRSVSFCQSLSVGLVSDIELANPDFIRDVRAFCLQLNISSYHWHDHLIDLYRDYRGHVLDESGAEIILNTCVFETPSIRDWFRDFCCTACPDHITPYVRGEAKVRVRVLATILRAVYPAQALLWGVRPANDNVPA